MNKGCDQSFMKEQLGKHATIAETELDENQNCSHIQ
jgi:hypothetical protein